MRLFHPPFTLPAVSPLAPPSPRPLLARSLDQPSLASASASSPRARPSILRGALSLHSPDARKRKERGEKEGHTFRSLLLTRHVYGSTTHDFFGIYFFVYAMTWFVLDFGECSFVVFVCRKYFGMERFVALGNVYSNF